MAEDLKVYRPSDRPLLLAPLEIPTRHPLACDHYAPRAAEMVALYGAVQWELVNLALFHRAAYAEVGARDRFLDELAAKDLPLAPAEMTGDERELFGQFQSRRRMAIYDREQEVAAIAGYADELAVIALWALAEKYLGQGLSRLGRTQKEYRWDKLVAGYRNAGIDLSALPGFASANECRQVNNALKHSGMVAEPLTTFPAFAGRLGAPLRRVELDVQRYLMGVHHLTGAALEQCGHVLSDTTQTHPYRTDSFGRNLGPAGA